VLLAGEAPVGVILRRGPSTQVATLLWNRKTDQFTMGQWFKGTIDERKSDLSPDGKHLIYFAAKYNSRDPMKTWTAISAAPYLKALVLIEGCGTWSSGGLWLTNDSYWCDDFKDVGAMQDSRAFRFDRNFKLQAGLDVYYTRLLRDGWERVRSATRQDKRDIFEKAAGPRWVLRKYNHYSNKHVIGRGSFWSEHELVHPNKEIVLPRPTWSWAEVEGNGVIWVEDGQLMRAEVASDGLGPTTLIRDFNDMSFEAIQAPY